MTAISRAHPSLFLLLAVAFTVIPVFIQQVLGQTCTTGGFACINCTTAQRCSSGTPFGPLLTCPPDTICNVNAVFECTPGQCFSCTVAGRFADPTTTTRYIICLTNAAATGGFDRIVVPCPTGTLFNTTTQSCVAMTATTFSCSEEGRFADDTNCSNYYMCKRTTSGSGFNVTKYACPGTTQFRVSSSTCVTRGTAGCTSG